MERNEQQTAKVEKWWNDNPYTYGLAPKENELEVVGKMSVDSLTVDFFDEIEKAFRHVSGGSGQKKDEPLLSEWVPYPKLKGKGVLDIAVGTGLHAVTFAKQGAIVTGIDITDCAVQTTKKNLQLRGLENTGAKIVKMDAQKLEFPDNYFSFINAWGCLHHMPDTEQAIREMFRVMEAGGEFLVFIYNKSSWSFWFNKVFLRGILLLYLPRCNFNVTKLVSRFSDGSTLGGNMHTKVYTPRQAGLLFTNAGFSNVKAFPRYIPGESYYWPLRKFPVFRYLPGTIKTCMEKYLGWGLIVTGRKEA